MATLAEDVRDLNHQLYDHEALQVEQMADLLEKFKERYMKYIGENILRVRAWSCSFRRLVRSGLSHCSLFAQIAACFKTLQDIAGNYHKTVQELVRALHEKYSVRDSATPASTGCSRALCPTVTRAERRRGGSREQRRGQVAERQGLLDVGRHRLARKPRRKDHRQGCALVVEAARC